MTPDRLSNTTQEIHKGWKGGKGWMGGRERSVAVLPFPPVLPGIFGAGGQIRTVDPALMRRVLSPTELLRLEPLIVTRLQMATSPPKADATHRHAT